MKHTGRLLLLVFLALVACGDSGRDRSKRSDETYSVVLMHGGHNKIALIKSVREITGLGLRDAKNLVDSSPSVVQSGLSHDAAKAAAEQLAATGAKVELKKQ